MARFGRGQPHAPIYLRAPLAGITVAALLAAQIHVVPAARRGTQNRARDFSRVIFLRGGQVATAAASFASQIHIVQQRRQPSVLATRVIQLHGAPSTVPPRLAPQIHVYQLGRQGVVRRTAVVFTRTALAATTQAPSAPQFTLILAVRQRAVPATHVVQTRGASSVVPAKLAPQVNVFSTRRRRPVPPTQVIIQRGPPAPIVILPRIAPQILVVTQRIRPAATRVVYAHGARSTIAPKLAPQIRVVSQKIRPPATRVVYLRARLVPPAPVQKCTEVLFGSYTALGVPLLDECGNQLPARYDGTYKYDGTITYGGGTPITCIVTPTFSPYCGGFDP